MTEDTKTASDIVAGIVKSKGNQITYSNLKSEYSKSYYNIMVKILTKAPLESETVTHLIMAHKHDLDGGRPNSPYPKWLRQIAYTINNPDGMYSKQLVTTVHELCSDTCLEYHKDTLEQQPTIQYLQQENNIGFISEAASVFAKEIPVTVN